MRYLSLLLLVMGSCRAPMESQPLATRPAILFLGFEIEEPGERFAVFELVNGTGTEYAYWQQMGPMYVTHDLGRPNPFAGARCGNGITEHRLAPGARVRLRPWIAQHAIGPIELRMDVRDPAGSRVELVSAPVELVANSGEPHTVIPETQEGRE